MENKIWYKIPLSNLKQPIKGIETVDGANCSLYEKQIQETIQLFNSDIFWDDMFTLEDAYDRLETGHKLYLLRYKDKPLGHLWDKNGYVYNVYVHPSRKKGTAELFFKSYMILSGHQEINLYTDDWNIKAQKFFEKVGGLKVNSYIV